MPKWTVEDRYGNEIYMTQERWDYILRYHDELSGLLDEFLDILRHGRRKQEPADPNKYKYYRRCPAMPPEYNTIVVVVKFSTRVDSEGTFMPNHFVITAWGTFIYREEY